MITEKKVIDDHSYHHQCSEKCLSWSAIIAGAFVGLGIGFLLYVFGAAIGLSSFKATPTGEETLAIGGFLGSVVGAIVSMFVGGWVSGYLASKYYGYRDYNHTYAEVHEMKSCGNKGALYGFITWVLALIVTILLADEVTSYVSMRYHSASDPTAAIVSTTANPHAPLVSDHRMNSDVNAPIHRTVNEEKAANVAGKTLFAMFIVFFLGAFASCVGGFVGIKSRCHHDDEGRRLNTTNTTTPRV